MPAAVARPSFPCSCPWALARSVRPRAHPTLCSMPLPQSRYVESHIGRLRRQPSTSLGGQEPLTAWEKHFRGVGEQIVGSRLSGSLVEGGRLGVGLVVSL